MPSPLGRVAERSEVGRGEENFCLIFRFKILDHLLASSVKNRLKTPVFATFPKGEGLAAALLYSNQLPDKREFGFRLHLSAKFP